MGGRASSWNIPKHVPDRSGTDIVRVADEKRTRPDSVFVSYRRHERDAPMLGKGLTVKVAATTDSRTFWLGVGLLT